MESNWLQDQPVSQGMANVLKRAKQFACFRWTPIGPFPVIGSNAGQTEKIPYHLPAWRPVTGCNYSATRFDEKYLGNNVSLYTFLTALSSPESVLYRRSLHGKANLSAAFYGTVCSAFASYAFDLPFHIDCQQWAVLPGIEPVSLQPIRNVRLCDVLLFRTRHIAFVTDILRTEDGEPVSITVTEATLSPSARPALVNVFLVRG